MTLLNLHGKTAFVFSGDSEVGKEVVELYIKMEANVLFFIRTAQDTFDLKYKSIDAEVSFGTFRTKDIFLKDIFCDLPEIDIIVNNLESKRGEDILDLSPEKWEKGLTMNLGVPFQLLKQLVPHMQTNGAIINLSSTTAIDGGSGDVLHAASKSALESMNKALSRELSSYKIRVNAISLGESEDMKSPGYIPSGRWGTAKGAANAILFLSSPMSEYINGQTVLLDGGKALS